MINVMLLGKVRFSAARGAPNRDRRAWSGPSPSHSHADQKIESSRPLLVRAQACHDPAKEAWLHNLRSFSRRSVSKKFGGCSALGTISITAFCSAWLRRCLLDGGDQQSEWLRTCSDVSL